MDVDVDSNSDMHNPQHTGTEDDPVVKKIPVYMATQLADKLALLQYLSRPPCVDNPHPLLPPSLRYPCPASIEARYKPGASQLEMNVPLEVEEGTREGRFSTERALELGHGIQKPEEQRRKGKDNSEENVLLSKLAMRGEPVPDQTNYCAAALKDNELHLTPLTSTLHVLPNLSYLDNLKALEKQAKAREKATQNDPEPSEDDAASESEKDKAKRKKPAKRDIEDAKAVQVSLKMSETASNRDRSNGRATAALFAPLRASESEAWVPLRHYNSTTPEVKEKYSGLYCKEQGELEQITDACQHVNLSNGHS